MSARASHRLSWGTLGALALWLCACKPEAPAETAAAGTPERGPSPAAEAAPQTAPDDDPGGQGATLAAGSPAPTEAVALETPKPAVVEAEHPADPPPETPVLPEQPLRVLILGDSFAATGPGALLEKKLDAHPHVVCYRKGKSASGLARPDFFDWMNEGKAHADWRKPDLVVVVMGGNDGQDLARRKGTGDRRVPWNHDDWSDAYRERVDRFLARVSAPGRKILWLGLPSMGLASLEKKLTIIREVQKSAVQALGEDAVYLDTAPFVTDDEGQMLTHANVGPRQKRQKIRADDKIHFTMSGSEYFAGFVYPEVLEVLGLPDVKAEP